MIKAYVMMAVWENEGSELCGVFSTKSNALEYLEILRSKNRSRVDRWFIDEVEMDNGWDICRDDGFRTVYHAHGDEGDA